MLTFAAAFLPFAVVTTFTPGPNNLMLAASGANFGIRRTIPHIMGIVTGFPLLVLAISMGLGTVFQRYPEVHTVLKFAGATFLLYLAWRIASAGHHEAKSATGRPLTFLEAALFQWVNPKAWVVAVSAIATYTTVGGQTSAEITVILIIFLIAAIGSTVTWTIFGVGISRFLKGSPRALRLFNITMAALLVLSIVPVMT